jgi:hypothetical protein
VCAISAISLEQAADREIVCLGPAGGENDLVRPGVYQTGNLVVGLVDRSPGLLPEKVYAGRVAELIF